MTATDPAPMSRHSAVRTIAPATTTAVHKMRRRRLRSQLLGDLIVDEDAILEFADGLFGFASCKQWVMVNAGRPGWCWLHALDHRALAFLLVDPFDVFAEFSVTLSPQDLAALVAQRATEVGVFAIVTLPRAAHETMTVNLQGPVAIVASSRRGRQLVLSDVRGSDPRFGARAPFTPDTQVLSGRTDTEA